jgi:hypothetical protein
MITIDAGIIVAVIRRVVIIAAMINENEYINEEISVPMNKMHKGRDKR